jgi:hypothetical protein
MEVVDRISISPTGPMGPFKGDAPLQQVVILKVELLADSSAPASSKGTTAEPAPASPPANPAAPSAGETPPAPPPPGAGDPAAGATAPKPQ